MYFSVWGIFLPLNQNGWQRRSFGLCDINYRVVGRSISRTV